MARELRPKDWQCQECGRLMTERAARRIVEGDGRCAGCGGVDVDIYVGDAFRRMQAGAALAGRD